MFYRNYMKKKTFLAYRNRVILGENILLSFACEISNIVYHFEDLRERLFGLNIHHRLA